MPGRPVRGLYGPEDALQRGWHGWPTTRWSNWWLVVISCEANIFFGGAARPACGSVGERSSLEGRTWVPNNVEFFSAVGVEVVDPWFSKFAVLEVASVVLAVSKFLG